MTVREYLQKQGRDDQITFVIAHAVKDENTPFNHYEYRTTAICCAWEWLEKSTWYDRYLVVNDDHPPVDITGNWVRWYKNGHLKCAVITTEEDIRATCGGEEQTQRMIAFYKRTVK